MKLLALVLFALSFSASAQPLCGHIGGFKINPANSPVAREIYLIVCRKGPRNPAQITISVTAQKLAMDEALRATLDRIENGPSEFLCINAVAAGDLKDLHLEYASLSDVDFAGNPVKADGKCPTPTSDSF